MVRFLGEAENGGWEVAASHFMDGLDVSKLDRPEFLPLLVELVKQGRCGQDTIDALGKIPQGKAVAAFGLVELLQSPDRKIRKRAARSLGLFGPEARPVLPSLMKGLKDPEDNEVEHAVYEAICKIAPGPELGPEIHFYHARHVQWPCDVEQVEEMARRALDHVKPADREVLVQALKDPSAWVQGWAAEALKRLEEHGKRH